MTRHISLIITLAVSILLLPSLSSAAETAVAKGVNHGEVSLQQGQAMAWDSPSDSWMTIDAFWQNWAETRGGVTWGSSSDYPEYDQVKEQDTFLVKLNGGTCMMEFWHGRWRRANDVRRWDDAFNDYSACPRVFE